MTVSFPMISAVKSNAKWQEDLMSSNFNNPELYGPSLSKTFVYEGRLWAQNYATAKAIFAVIDNSQTTIHFIGMKGGFSCFNSDWPVPGEGTVYLDLDSKLGIKIRNGVDSVTREPRYKQQGGKDVVIALEKYVALLHELGHAKQFLETPWLFERPAVAEKDIEKAAIQMRDMALRKELGLPARQMIKTTAGIGQKFNMASAAAASQIAVLERKATNLIAQISFASRAHQSREAARLRQEFSTLEQQIADAKAGLAKGVGAKSSAAPMPVKASSGPPGPPPPPAASVGGPDTRAMAAESLGLTKKAAVKKAGWSVPVETDNLIRHEWPICRELGMREEHLRNYTDLVVMK